MDRTRRQLLKALAVSPLVIEIAGCQAPLPPAQSFPPTDPSTPLNIDVHTHVFNGSDLQISAFLKFIYKSNPDVAALLEDLAWDLAPTATAELTALQEVATTGTLFASGIFIEIYDRHTEKSYRNAVQSLKDAVAKANARLSTRGLILNPSIQSTIGVLPRTYREYKASNLRSAAPRSTIDGLINFIIRNFQYRYVNVYDYLE